MVGRSVDRGYFGVDGKDRVWFDTGCYWVVCLNR